MTRSELTEELERVEAEIHRTENQIRNRCPELFAAKARLVSKRRKIRMEIDYLDGKS